MEYRIDDKILDASVLLPNCLYFRNISTMESGAGFSGLPGRILL